MQRVLSLLRILAVVVMASGCAVQSATSNTPPGQTASTAQATTAPSSPVPQALPTGSSLACQMFTTQDFVQVYGTALMSVSGANGSGGQGNEQGRNSDCTYRLSTAPGANVSIELNCGASAQLLWDEEETANYQSLTGGPPGAVEQLDGNGLPEAITLTADGVYLSIDDESVGSTPPGLNPVPDTKVTAAMNLAYANVEREKPCR